MGMSIRFWVKKKRKRERKKKSSVLILFEKFKEKEEKQGNTVIGKDSLINITPWNCKQSRMPYQSA